MVPMISPGRAGGLEEADGVAQEPPLARPLELPAVLASAGQQAVTPGAKRREAAAPGGRVFLGPLQHGHAEDAEDASRTEAAAEHANRLCNVLREDPGRSDTEGWSVPVASDGRFVML